MPDILVSHVWPKCGNPKPVREEQACARQPHLVSLRFPGQPVAAGSHRHALNGHLHSRI
ncbi:hypothetical protein DPMN_011671 [Dreissena polymorpha]|uniref:Uncharacterized protein n=1 Tax=Dreissena polymorpha TaxID=45954 RepID=A0A9D4S245_DREPO|nr:hypothetical protein DPMN_011671 [Dreissena polymorpha]